MLCSHLFLGVSTEPKDLGLAFPKRFSPTHSGHRQQTDSLLVLSQAKCTPASGLCTCSFLPLEHSIPDTCTTHILSLFWGHLPQPPNIKHHPSSSLSLVYLVLFPLYLLSLHAGTWFFNCLTHLLICKLHEGRELWLLFSHQDLEQHLAWGRVSINVFERMNVCMLGPSLLLSQGSCISPSLCSRPWPRTTWAGGGGRVRVALIKWPPP